MSRSDFTQVKSHFAHADPKISKILEDVDLSVWFVEKPSEDHFYNLTRNIIYQQLAGKAADAIFTRFQALVGTVTPGKIIQYEDQAFRDVGLSWAKAKYVKDLASKVTSGEINLQNIESLDNESVISELTKVKGIGRWTAEMFLLFTLHRENIFSYGDLGLKNGFIKLYGSTLDMAEIVSRWDPYQSYGSIALWHFLDNT